MSLRNKPLPCALLVVLAGLMLHNDLVLPHSQTSAQKKPYTVTGQESTVYGTVMFTGDAPVTRGIDMSADPVCEKLNKKPTKTWLSVKNAMVADVLVFLSKGQALDSYSFEIPSTPVTLEHTKCNYLPHVLGVQAGQVFAVLNSDGTQHNTHPTPKVNIEWNMSQGVGGEPIIKTFERFEVGIPFKCNQHPWEKAYVSVFKHPFFAVTDATGNFRIEGIPPGEYFLTTWHEVLAPKSVEIMLTPSETRHTVFSFAESDISEERGIKAHH